MTKLVVLKFSGSLKSGLSITLEIGWEGQAMERGGTGSLPPAVELDYYLHTWQQQYYRLSKNCRIEPQQVIYDGSTNPAQQLIKLTYQFQKKLLTWLGSSSFRPIDQHLREELNRGEPARMLICSDCPEIHQLPWGSWDLLESYPQLEIAMSNPNFARVPSYQPKHHRPGRILAILGDSEGLNLEADRAFLNTLELEVKFLVEPTIPELYDSLWNGTWDIVFFAGHSRSQKKEGILYLNRRDRLTIKQLKHGFKRAIASGLQLAIFNSCDGLGLAEELAGLSLPQSIVMRQPVPDEIAQKFVRFLLEAYAADNSLYLAMRKARERLQGFEQQFPCASWLPVIYQNPAVIPPQWSDLVGKADLPASSLPATTFKLVKFFISSILIAAIVTTLVWLIQFWGWLEAAEFKAYDRLMVWGYSPTVDQKVLVITIDDQDRIYQEEQDIVLSKLGSSSLADPILNRLLQKLNSAQAKAIASDIIHDFPFTEDLAQTIASNNNFVSICRINNLPKLISIAPAQQLSRQQIGFSNWAIDNDGTIRRQIVGMSPDPICQTGYSLSLRLALKYLGDVVTEFNNQSSLIVGGAEFPRLTEISGRYDLSETQGYQILLNYRRAFPPAQPLREVLTMAQPELNRLVKDKIVLIGVAGHNHDLHHTPYSRGRLEKRLPGVMIHALMTSQIIDIVSGAQKPIAWLSCRLENLWLAFWSLSATVIIFWLRRSPVKIMVGIILSLGLIFYCCWLLLLNGIWLTVIAPALALMLSATITLGYLKNWNLSS